MMLLEMCVVTYTWMLAHLYALDRMTVSEKQGHTQQLLLLLDRPVYSYCYWLKLWNWHSLLLQVLVHTADCPCIDGQHQIDD
jgi:hypothetical protein